MTETTVAEILEVEDKTSKAGKPYTVTTFKGGDGVLYKDVFGKFTVGQAIKGAWKTNEYGKKFEIERSAGGAGFSRNDPATQANIMRQNALTNAVAYVTAKAQLMEAKDGLKFLTGKEVIQVATYFYRFSCGDITVYAEKEAPSAPQSQPEAKEVVKVEDIEPPEGYNNEGEVDITDVPF